jgi:hypothetical protein
MSSVDLPIGLVVLVADLVNGIYEREFDVDTDEL